MKNGERQNPMSGRLMEGISLDLIGDSKRQQAIRACEWSRIRSIHRVLIFQAQENGSRETAGNGR
jgi:hypothetical protein